MRRKLLGLAMSVVGALAVLNMPTLAVTSQLCNDLSAGTPDYIAAGCGDQKSAGEVATAVIEVVLGFIGVVAVCIVIYGGFLFLSSSGDAMKVKRGKDAIKYGLIGLVVTLLASGIVMFVSKAIEGV